MAQDLEYFVTQLTASQTSVYAYLMSLVLDPVAAEDLLQETNLTLWRKSADYEPGTNFTAWACAIAHFKVREFRRTQARDHLQFDDGLLERIADRLETRADQLEPRRHALQQCLGKLPDDQRRMIEERYEQGGSVKSLANQLDRPTGSVSQTLYRIRLSLLECVRDTLGPEGDA